MSLFVAVLDACVLYPMYLRDTLLRAAESGLYRVHWSPDILEELHRNLLKSGRVSEKQAQYVIQQLQSAFPEANVIDYQDRIAPMLNDPKDRHVTAAATVCGAHIIVTDNLKDFPAEALAPFSLKALTADTFLIQLFAQEPDLMANIIADQAADYSVRPMSTNDLLGRLLKHAPTFTQLVRTRLLHQP